MRSFLKNLALLVLCTSFASAQSTQSGGKWHGGTIASNVGSGGGPSDYPGLPHNNGTAVNITSVPNAGLSTAAACGGNQLSMLVNCGNLSGSGTILTDTQFSSTLGGPFQHYIRLTDAHFVDGFGSCAAFSGAGASNSFEVGPGGGDYTNAWNTNHTFVFVAQQASGVLVVPIRSDFGASACPLWPTGSGDTGPYSSLNTSGLMDITAWWSGVNPNVFYIMPDTAIYKMTMSGCDLTHLTIAQGCTVTSSLVHDFNGDGAFTTELAPCAGITTCWSGVFDVDRSDRYFLFTMAVLGDTFSVNLALTAQDTGTKAGFYDTVNGSMEYETRKGLVSPHYNAPPSVPLVDQNSLPLFDRGGIHDDTAARSGAFNSIGGSQCALNTATLPTPRTLSWSASGNGGAGGTYKPNSWIIPADGNNTKGAAMYTVLGGPPGGTEPVWDSATQNVNITDGGVTWQYPGSYGALVDWRASTPIAAWSFWQPTTNNPGGYTYQNINPNGGVTGTLRPTFNQTGNSQTTDNGSSGPIWLNVGNNSQGFGANQCPPGPGADWQPSTGLVFYNPDSPAYTGHYIMQTSSIVVGGGTLTFGARKFGAWTNTQPLIPNNPACTAVTCPGQHISGGNNNPTDTNVIIGGMAYGTNALNTKLSADTTGCQNGSTFPVSCAAIPNSPGYEIVGFQQLLVFCGNPNSSCDTTDSYIRFGLGFDTGQSGFFNGQQMTGSVSQDGLAEAFSSDWECTVGNTAKAISITSFLGASGTLTFTNSGTNNLEAGALLTLGGFTSPNIALNGQQITVLPAGLASTSFEATVTGNGYLGGSGIANGTSASPNAIDWKASQTWTTGTIINPSVGNGSGATNYDYVATTGGTGSATEPTWATSCSTLGSTCTEGGVVWTRIGSPNGTTPASANCRIDAWVLIL